MLGAGEVLQDIAFVVLVMLGIGCGIALMALGAFFRELRNPVGDRKPRDHAQPRPYLTLLVNDHWVAP